MSADSIARDIAEATELPRLVRLGDRLIGAAFDVMKTLPARHMIDAAIARGDVGPGTTIVETTSGTFGLGLAMVCAVRGIPLRLVSDPAIDGYLRERIEDLGASVEVMRTPHPSEGFQGARLAEVRRICSTPGSWYVPSQYANPINPASYTALSTQLLHSLGHAPAAVVGTVGSGGSMCGTVTALRRHDPAVRAIGVDTHGSILFGQDEAPRMLRGLGNSILPANLDHRVFDEVHWVDAASAFDATRALHRDRGLYMGPTSGAAWLVAQRVAAETETEGDVVVILPDTGHRYESTVYHDTWLLEHGYLAGHRAVSPIRVAAPPRHGSGWQRIPWNRRTLGSMLAQRTASPSASERQGA